MCPFPIYLTKQMMDVPCGHCGYCLRRRINDWVIRCKWEVKRNPYSYFLTLTFKEVPEELYFGTYKVGKQTVNSFKYPLQLFFKRVRKLGINFRYFALGDYGDTYGRPHYHVLFFSCVPVNTDLIHSLWSSPKHQKNGFVTVDHFSVHRVRYVVEYGLLARLDWDENDKRPQPFFVMSKRPAIGSNFLSRANVVYHRRVNPLYREGDYEYGLPRYYKKKIFDYNSKTGLGFRSPDFREDMVIRTQTQVKALSKYHRNPESYLIDRRMRSAAVFLQKLRERKKFKNKLL